MADRDAPMTLRLLTPEGVRGETGCDSVQLVLRDGASGQGGGSVGIQRNHTPAVMALGPGKVRASLAGRVVLEAAVDGGFASVRDNVITVITDSIRTPAAPKETE